MGGRTDGWMDGRTDGWLDGWMDGWTDGRMDEWMFCLFLSIQYVCPYLTFDVWARTRISNDFTHVGYFLRGFRFSDCRVLMWLERAAYYLFRVVTFGIRKKELLPAF